MPTCVSTASSRLVSAGSRKDKHQDVLGCPATMEEGSDDDELIGTTCCADDSNWECLQVFEPSMVAQGLSQLSRTASGHHTAYLQLNLSGTTLEDPTAVIHCQHVQALNISGNSITSLRALGQLRHLTCLDASHNQLTQVLDMAAVDSSSSNSSSEDADAAAAGSNLRSADLSYNQICQIRAGLSGFKLLAHLVLDGNQLEFVGGAVKELRALTHLSLSGNRIASLSGLEGLSSLRELQLDGNRLSSLSGLLGHLTGLEVLQVAHNQLTSCDGVQALTSLRVLNVSGNLLRRLEQLCPCRGLRLLAELDVTANPLEAAQNTRLHLIFLLPQVSCMNGATVSSIEKVDAANMAGAAAEGLLAIRMQFFPSGELDDGGGAVPPTAAGLVPSRAEEERSCSDPDAMFAAIDAWACSVPVTEALSAAAGNGRASAPGSATCRSSCPGSTCNGSTDKLQDIDQREDAPSLSRPESTSSSNSKGQTTAAAAAARNRPPGVAAIAARLAAGCSKDAPWAQLQLARACHCWVVSHVKPPRGCDVTLGVDAVTWDVGLHLFGEEEEQQQLHEALLSGHSGTFAECVSELLVSLVKACHMEAVQLSCYWKAGGQGSVAPGSRLGSHNHSWCAVKVNGRWRLLDPVYSIIREGIPFYLPPEAFIHTHLPFEAYWQLLASPVSLEEWWQRPEVSLAFCAVGGQLLDETLKSCIVTAPTREGQVLPCIRIPVTAPATNLQYLQLKLLDSNGQLLAKWQHYQGSHVSSRSYSQGSGSSICRVGHHYELGAVSTPQPCLVYQQCVLSASGQHIVAVGHEEHCVAEQELWVSLPSPGTFFVHTEMVQETPGLMQLSVAGLNQPLDITLRQQEDVLRLKVVVPPVQPHNPADGICVDAATHTAALPVPQQPGFSVCDGQLQLLSPAPGKVLEADQQQVFEVLAPGVAAVAVGSDELGWTQLTRAAAPGAGGGSGRASSAGGTGMSAVKVAKEAAAQALFRGTVVVPRAAKCLVAARFAGVLDCQWSAEEAAADGSHVQGSREGPLPWAPVLSLCVRPQVQHLVAVPDPAPLSDPDPMDPGLPRVRRLLAALDTDCDGVISRRDMLTAFRRDRQLADHLKMPPRTKAGDGTLERFLARFQAINKDGLGYIDLKQLWASFAEQPVASSRLSTAATMAAADNSKIRQASAKSTASRYSVVSGKAATGASRSSAVVARAGAQGASPSRRMSMASAVGAAGGADTAPRKPGCGV